MTTTTTPVRERTRREIVGQAMVLFQSKGYSATSLQDIATAAGCSKATVLYHFNGKPAVLSAVLAPSRAALAELNAAAAKLPRAQAQELAVTRFVELAVEFRAGSDDPLERALAEFAINGLLGECRHSGERTDAELHALCDTALRRILRLPD